MAAKKTKSVRDQLPNRKYVKCTFAAATTTAVYTQFDTMMGARDGAGWLISRVDVTFGGAVPPTQSWGNDLSLRFQLLTGAQTTTLTPDDDEVIATIDYTQVFATSGAAARVWPLSWAGPVLVASRQLTVAMDGSTDLAPFQSQEMIFTLWYNWVKIGAREWVEIAEARGVA